VSSINFPNCKLNDKGGKVSQKNLLDPRVQRSRQWMKTALLELINEKSYEKISVTDITDRAGLSRPTFYLHYSSKDEILMDHLDTIFDPIMEEFHELRQNIEIDQPGSIAMTKMFEGIFDQIDIFRTVWQAGAEKLLIQRMYQRNLIYLKDLAQRCEMEITPEILELSAHFMAGAFVGIIINWLQEECPHPPEKMGEFITEATRSLLRTAICNGELNYIFN
jgi:AcrR family transcriptional regulator